ncbi:hypothetical protein SAMN05192563_102482 [Paraburkholderia aspalathi]|uniref:Uncharacterized protein n=1 Tax=Paraburkholderia aspalathi TaxID=1324617 RepID=A0A1I7EJD1_9BURK|nr:hypothetical protein SAMN05192563_102482 [Paraburkholderia aspalathi]
MMNRYAYLPAADECLSQVWVYHEGLLGPHAFRIQLDQATAPALIC